MTKRTKIIVAILVVLCAAATVCTLKYEEKESQKRQETLVQTLQEDEVKRKFSCCLLIDDRYTIHIVKERGVTVVDIDDDEHNPYAYKWEEGVLTSYSGQDSKKKEKCTFEELEKRFQFSMEEIAKDWKSHLAEADKMDISSNRDSHNLYNWEMERLKKKQIMNCYVTSSKDGKHYEALFVRNETRMEYKQKVQYEIFYSNVANMDPQNLLASEYAASRTKCWSMRQIKGEENIDYDQYTFD